jgi:hypothetical protein
MQSPRLSVGDAARSAHAPLLRNNAPPVGASEAILVTSRRTLWLIGSGVQSGRAGLDGHRPVTKLEAAERPSGASEVALRELVPHRGPLKPSVVAAEDLVRAGNCLL